MKRELFGGEGCGRIKRLILQERMNEDGTVVGRTVYKGDGSAGVSA